MTTEGASGAPRDPVLEAVAQAIGNVLVTRGSTYEAAEAALAALGQAGWTVMRPLTPEEEAADVW